MSLNLQLNPTIFRGPIPSPPLPRSSQTFQQSITSSCTLPEYFKSLAYYEQTLFEELKKSILRLFSGVKQTLSNSKTMKDQIPTTKIAAATTTATAAIAYTHKQKTTATFNNHNICDEMSKLLPSNTTRSR